MTFLAFLYLWSFARLLSVLWPSVPTGSFSLESQMRFCFALLLFVKYCFLMAPNNKIGLLQYSLQQWFSTRGKFETCPPIHLDIWQCLEAFWLSHWGRGVAGREPVSSGQKPRMRLSVLWYTGSPSQQRVLWPKTVVPTSRNCFRSIVLSLCSVLESPVGGYVPSVPRSSQSDSLSRSIQASGLQTVPR